jgi:alcohol dehydrogenase
MTGYENVGIVIALGPEAGRVRVGDRVVVTYGHRTHAVIPEGKAIVVPHGISDELAMLLILSGDVATGIRKLGEAIREPVLVTGAGAIGLLAVFVLTALGALAVDVVEPQADRRALALALGARRAVTPDGAATLDDDYAAGVECSSRDAAFALLQSRVRPHGRICVVADGNLEPLTLAPAFHARQLTVVGTSDCPDYHAHARWYFPAVQRTDGRLARLFDRRIAAADLPATFADLASGESSAIKVFVRYNLAG